MLSTDPSSIFRFLARTSSFLIRRWCRSIRAAYRTNRSTRPSQSTNSSASCARTSSNTKYEKEPTKFSRSMTASTTWHPSCTRWTSATNASSDRRSSFVPILQSRQHSSSTVALGYRRRGYPKFNDWLEFFLILIKFTFWLVQWNEKVIFHLIHELVIKFFFFIIVLTMVEPDELYVW